MHPGGAAGLINSLSTGAEAPKGVPGPQPKKKHKWLFLIYLIELFTDL
jgi:hypothetical protein